MEHSLHSQGPLAAAPPVNPGERPPVAGETTPAFVTSPERRNHRGRRYLAGVLVGVAALGGVINFAVNHDGSTGSANAAAAVSQLSGGESYDACPDGMFPNGAYESSLDVSTPNDLHRRPESTLNDATNLTDYFFGHNGVACESAATLAVVKQGFIDMLGDGAAKTYDFDTFGTVNEQADIYAAKPDVAGKDADKLASIMQANSTLNEVDLRGDYYQVIGVVNGDKVEAQLQKVQKTFAKETVFVTILGGDQNAEGINQIMVTDRETGQVWFLNAVGTIPEANPDEAQNQDQGNQGQGGNGGGQFGTTNGNGESNQPGNVRESGGNGGATTGTTPSFGNGGGGSTGTVTVTTGGTTNTTSRVTTTTGGVTTTVTQPHDTTTTGPSKPPKTTCTPGIDPDC